MKRPSRRGLTALAVAASVPLLSACGALSQTSTELEYNPSDGVSAQVGQVVARNLLVVGDAGKEGLVSGALVNNGTSDAVVTVETKGQPQPVRVSVPAGGLVTLGSGTDQTPVVVGNLSAQPGSMLDVTLSSPNGGQVVTSVPVLPPTMEYSTVTPPAN